MSSEFDVDATIRAVTDKLVAQYPHRSRTGLNAVVRDQVRALQDSPITDYISVIAEREVKRQLKLE